MGDATPHLQILQAKAPALLAALPRSYPSLPSRADKLARRSIVLPYAREWHEWNRTRAALYTDTYPTHYREICLPLDAVHWVAPARAKLSVIVLISNGCISRTRPPSCTFSLRPASSIKLLS